MLKKPKKILIQAIVIFIQPPDKQSDEVMESKHKINSVTFKRPLQSHFLITSLWYQGGYAPPNNSGRQARQSFKYIK